MMRIVLLIIIFALCTPAKTIYVALNGNDSNPGTFELPYLKIQTGITKAVAGDTVYIRGGVYAYNYKINISTKATELARIYLLNYPGEHPVLDFRTIASGNRGMELKGNYWYIRGLEIYGAGDNGMFISGQFNIIDNCSFHDNKDTGLQLGSGATKNRIINCDAYFNRDASEGNADGFAPKLDVGDSNYFYGCRAWQNSDDGWDGYLRPSDNVTTILENCWCFMNGYRPDGVASSGNGNGFKMGGSDSKLLKHNFVLINCVAFDNRVKGFDQNNNKGSITLYNCSAYRNGTNYGVGQLIDTAKRMTIKNSLAYGSTGSILSSAIQSNNSWISPLSCSLNDFVSVDTTGVRGPRQADGSLPVLDFLRLKSSSPLIDAGVSLGFPYMGTAPDIGAFEFDPLGVTEDGLLSDKEFLILGNYPNPFNPTTHIRFQLPSKADVVVTVYNAIGQVMSKREMLNLSSGEHTTSFDGFGLASGMYLYEIRTAGAVKTGKMLLLK